MSNENLGLVHIVDMGGESKAFPINGGGLTAREVIADFFESEHVEDLLAEKSFRLVNRGPITAANVDRPLAHGDTITVYTNEVATGGVKGASEAESKTAFDRLGLNAEDISEEFRLGYDAGQTDASLDHYDERLGNMIAETEVTS